MRSILLASLLTVMTASPLLAEPVVHVGPEKSPISTTVTVPTGAKTVYVSGLLAPVIDPAAPVGSIASYGDTKTQTMGAIKKIDEALKAQGLGLGDIVMMHVYLLGDPDKGGKMDFAGMMAGYTQFFGTPEQPNKPSRATIQVAALAGPGYLVEIEVVAAKAP